MQADFNLAKMAQNAITKIASITKPKTDSIKNDAQNTAKQKEENELQSVELLNIITFDGTSKTEDEIADYIEQLDKAIETPDKNTKETIENILLESDLNSSDILSIMASRSGKKDWLTEGIKKNFSGKKEEKLLKTIAHVCTEMSQSKDSLASGLAMNYIKTIDDINKFFKNPNEDDSNIRVSNMITGIRG